MEFLTIFAYLAQWTIVAALKNPVLSGWNPDPTILRVGKDYFLATSSFEYFPGTPIYHSTDLANWELYSHAQTRPSQIQLYGTPTGAGLQSGSTKLQWKG